MELIALRERKSKLLVACTYWAIENWANQLIYRPPPGYVRHYHMPRGKSDH